MGWLPDYIADHAAWPVLIDSAFIIGLLLYKRFKARRRKTED